ncbi:MAG: glycosyltransferase family 2 protein [bacterium]|nr:glycosyltransferase family 2 protein [bacterium]
MSPTEKPTVSVVVPAFNAELTLYEAYESVALQDGASWEMIIVDNNSTDRTSEVGAAIAAEDPRVKLVQELRQGVFHARNRGIDEANGEFIAFFDSDDIMGPDALRNRVQAIQDNPDCTLSYCVANYVGPKLEPLKWAYDNREVVTYEQAFGNPCAVGSALLGRTEAIREVRFPPRTHGEDWLYLARLLRAGHQMVRADDCHVLYRQSAESAVHSKILHHERSCVEVLDLIYGPDPEVESAPEWVNGLTSPPIETAKGRRLLRLLTYTLMAEDAEQANLALGMLEAVPYLSPSKTDVDAALTVSVARARHLPRDEVKEHWFPTLMTIARTARAIKLDERFPAFATVLDEEVVRLVGERWLSGPSQTVAAAPPKPEPDGAVRLAIEMFQDSNESPVAVAVRTPDPEPVLRLADAGWTILAFEPGETRRAELYANLRSGMDVRVDMRRPSVGADWTDPAHIVDLDQYLASAGIERVDLLLVAKDGEPDSIAGWIAAMERKPHLVISHVDGPDSGAHPADAIAEALKTEGYGSLVAAWPENGIGTLTILAAPEGDSIGRLSRDVKSVRPGVSLHRLP